MSNRAIKWAVVGGEINNAWEMCLPLYEFVMRYCFIVRRVAMIVFTYVLWAFERVPLALMSGVSDLKLRCLVEQCSLFQTSF